MLRCCMGVRLPSKMMSPALCAVASARISSSLPRPTRVAESAAVAHLVHRGGNFGSGAAREFDEFVERVLALLGEHVRGDALCALECNADQHDTFEGGGGLSGLHRSAWREHRSRVFRLRRPEFANLPSSRDYTLRSRVPRVCVSCDCIRCGAALAIQSCNDPVTNSRAAAWIFGESPKPSSHCTPASLRNQVICRFA